MKYQVGDQTYKIIGNKLGKITPTMVNRLLYSASEKIKILVYDKPIKSFSIEEDEAFALFIDNCRTEAFDKFVILFKKAEYDIYDFLMLLKKNQYLSEGDLKIFKEIEIHGLIEIKQMLLNNKINEVKRILLNDINKDVNIFTTYQNIISRIAFPNKKRGRPKKEDN